MKGPIRNYWVCVATRNAKYFPLASPAVSHLAHLINLYLIVVSEESTIQRSSFRMNRQKKSHMAISVLPDNNPKYKTSVQYVPA